MTFTIGIHPLSDCDLKTLEDEYNYGMLECESNKSTYDNLRLNAIFTEIEKRKLKNEIF